MPGFERSSRAGFQKFKNSKTRRKRCSRPPRLCAIRARMREILVHNAARQCFELGRGARLAIIQAIQMLDSNRGKFLGGCPDGELSLVLLTDAALARLHGKFLGNPAATDVITFEGDPAAGTAGEICVSVDMAVNYAGARGGGVLEELILYFVHGWLHLAGYDDRQPREKRKMRAAEKRAMKLLREAGMLPPLRGRATE